MLRDGSGWDESRSRGEKKTDLRHQIGRLFGSVLVRALAGTHIRAFARSTVAAPGPVGRTGFSRADSFLMQEES